MVLVVMPDVPDLLQRSQKVKHQSTSVPVSYTHLDDLKKKYFTKVGSSYQISDEIKKRVEFKKHDLLKDCLLYTS